MVMTIYSGKCAIMTDKVVSAWYRKVLRQDQQVQHIVRFVFEYLLSKHEQAMDYFAEVPRFRLKEGMFPKDRDGAEKWGKWVKNASLMQKEFDRMILSNPYAKTSMSVAKVFAKWGNTRNDLEIFKFSETSFLKMFLYIGFEIQNLFSLAVIDQAEDYLIGKFVTKLINDSVSMDPNIRKKFPKDQDYSMSSYFKDVNLLASRIAYHMVIEEVFQIAIRPFYDGAGTSADTKVLWKGKKRKPKSQTTLFLKNRRLELVYDTYYHVDVWLCPLPRKRSTLKCMYFLPSTWFGFLGYKLTRVSHKFPWGTCR